MSIKNNALRGVVVLISLQMPIWGATTGSIFGTLKDPSGGVIPGAQVTVTNISQGIQTKTTTDEKGIYNFPSLTVGRYNLEAAARGFKIAKRSDLAIDLDTALQTDLTLEVIEKVEEVTVSENAVQIDTATSQAVSYTHLTLPTIYSV